LALTCRVLIVPPPPPFWCGPLSFVWIFLPLSLLFFVVSGGGDGVSLGGGGCVPGGGFPRVWVFFRGRLGPPLVLGGFLGTREMLSPESFVTSIATRNTAPRRRQSDRYLLRREQELGEDRPWRLRTMETLRRLGSRKGKEGRLSNRLRGWRVSSRRVNRRDRPEETGRQSSKMVLSLGN